MSLQGALRARTLHYTILHADRRPCHATPRRDAPHSARWCDRWTVAWLRQVENGAKFSPPTWKESVYTRQLAFWHFRHAQFLFFSASRLHRARVKGVSGSPPVLHNPPLLPGVLYTSRRCRRRHSLPFLSREFLRALFARYLNAERNEAVKMFRHAQFIMDCEW